MYAIVESLPTLVGISLFFSLEMRFVSFTPEQTSFVAALLPYIHRMRMRCEHLSWLPLWPTWMNFQFWISLFWKPFLHKFLHVQNKEFFSEGIFCGPLPFHQSIWFMRSVFSRCFRRLSRARGRVGPKSYHPADLPYCCCQPCFRASSRRRVVLSTRPCVSFFWIPITGWAPLGQYRWSQFSLSPIAQTWLVRQSFWHLFCVCFSESMLLVCIGYFS